MYGEKLRTISFYKRYFTDFYKKQEQKVKDKILWTLRMIEYLERIPSEYFKHIEGTAGIYEIRIRQSSNIYRIFCFFDEERIVILINGFQKKDPKTPKSEIEKAEKIKNEYDSQK